MSKACKTLVVGSTAIAVYTSLNPTIALFRVAAGAASLLSGMTMWEIWKNAHLKCAQASNNFWYHTTPIIGTWQNLPSYQKELEAAFKLLQNLPEYKEDKVFFDAQVQQGLFQGECLEIIDKLLENPTLPSLKILEEASRIQVIYNEVLYRALIQNGRVDPFGMISNNKSFYSSDPIEKYQSRLEEHIPLEAEDYVAGWLEIEDENDILTKKEIVHCNSIAFQYSLEKAEKPIFRYYDPSPGGGFYDFPNKASFLKGLRIQTLSFSWRAIANFKIRLRAQV